jgi:guanine nucleotide exchange factor VAV
MVKREYSIRELVESEKRYIEAIGMIKTNFIGPLSTFLREDEKKCIFHGIEVFFLFPSKIKKEL